MSRCKINGQTIRRSSVPETRDERVNRRDRCAQDRLFETLDPTRRSVTLPGRSTKLVEGVWKGNASEVLLVELEH